jgi:hypothetical protein
MAIHQSLESYPQSVHIQRPPQGQGLGFVIGTVSLIPHLH